MKSIKVTNTGGPEVLKLEEITLDKPGADEVQIEHVSIGLNYIDTYHGSGLYPLQLPTGIGMEAAGIIKEVGSNVSNFSVGDKIAYAAAPLGAYSTHRNYTSKNIVKVPNGIDLEVISSAMTKGMTTFYLLHKTYVPKEGETVLFHAAAGGVGQFFCQWAKSLNLKVIGTVGSEEKIEIAKKYGCDDVINYSKEDFAKKVMELTGGKGVSVVYDGVGKSTYTGVWEGEVDFEHQNLFGGGETLGMVVRRGTKDEAPSVRIKYNDDHFGLEGGYDLRALAASAKVFVNELIEAQNE